MLPGRASVSHHRRFSPLVSHVAVGMSERWHGSARARNQEQRENISHCWRYSCLDSTSLQDERFMSRDSLQWIFMAEYASYALAGNRHRQTWIWGYMHRRAMILDTFASKNQSKCIPKALWGRLWSRLGPTWSRRGQNIKNKTKKTLSEGHFWSQFWALFESWSPSRALRTSKKMIF